MKIKLLPIAFFTVVIAIPLAAWDDAVPSLDLTYLGVQQLNDSTVPGSVPKSEVRSPTREMAESMTRSVDRTPYSPRAPRDSLPIARRKTTMKEEQIRSPHRTKSLTTDPFPMLPAHNKNRRLSFQDGLVSRGNKLADEDKEGFEPGTVPRYRSGQHAGKKLLIPRPCTEPILPDKVATRETSGRRSKIKSGGSSPSKRSEENSEWLKENVREKIRRYRIEEAFVAYISEEINFLNQLLKRYDEKIIADRISQLQNQVDEINRQLDRGND